MKYDKAYIQSKDIDWFCVIGGVYCHIASAGGVLPDQINDREKLRDIQKKVSDASDMFTENDIVINNEFLLQRFGRYDDNRDAIEAYLESFRNMTRKGFVSIDRTDVMNTSENLYHIVCYPKERRDLSEFFPDLVQVDGNLFHGQPVNIHLLEFFE